MILLWQIVSNCAPLVLGFYVSPTITQVFINYGPHDNTTLWMEYGFTVQNNPHSVVHGRLL